MKDKTKSQGGNGPTQTGISGSQPAWASVCHRPTPEACGAVRTTRSGMTLVEVMVALALVTLLTAGLYDLGLTVRRLSEHNSAATEARAFAKERIEEMVAMGRANLAFPGCLMMSATTNTTEQGYTMIRQPRIVWHGADRRVVGASTSVYAEVHVDVRFFSPLKKRFVTSTYSTLVQ